MVKLQVLSLLKYIVLMISKFLQILGLNLQKLILGHLWRKRKKMYKSTQQKYF